MFFKRRHYVKSIVNEFIIVIVVFHFIQLVRKERKDNYMIDNIVTESLSYVIYYNYLHISCLISIDEWIPNWNIEIHKIIQWYVEMTMIDSYHTKKAKKMLITDKWTMIRNHFICFYKLTRVFFTISSAYRKQ